MVWTREVYVALLMNSVTEASRPSFLSRLNHFQSSPPTVAWWLTNLLCMCVRTEGFPLQRVLSMPSETCSAMRSYPDMREWVCSCVSFSAWNLFPSSRNRKQKRGEISAGEEEQTSPRRWSKSSLNLFTLAILHISLSLTFFFALRNVAKTWRYVLNHPLDIKAPPVTAWFSFLHYRVKITLPTWLSPCSQRMKRHFSLDYWFYI